jgi:replicative DNA helicase
VVRIVELTEGVFSSAHITHYAEIVRQKSTLRKLIKAGSDMIALGFDEHTEISSLLEKAEQYIFRVTQNFTRNQFIHLRDILNHRSDEFKALNEDPEYYKQSRIESGFGNLDHALGGFKP